MVRLQALLGERGVVETVAGAIEADHESIADQLVVADAFDVDDILDARRCCKAHARLRQHQRRGNKAEQNALEIEMGHLAVPGVRHIPMRRDRQQSCENRANFGSPGEVVESAR